MKPFNSKIWVLRLTALLAPAFTVFYSGIYEHPDTNERKILQICLLTGSIMWISVAVILYTLK